ncbi:MAG: DUF3783 domain-containing protein [Eubacteriales bacterium]|nr:DUF3783 domain-containing protein [Eubacteriales bacterium]
MSILMNEALSKRLYFISENREDAARFVAAFARSELRQYAGLEFHALDFDASRKHPLREVLIRHESKTSPYTHYWENLRSATEGLRSVEPVAASPLNLEGERLLLFFNLDPKEIRTLLGLLRNLPRIQYKAALTEQNIDWFASELLVELREEAAFVERYQKLRRCLEEVNKFSQFSQSIREEPAIIAAENFVAACRNPDQSRDIEANSIATILRDVEAVIEQIKSRTQDDSAQPKP